MPEDHEKRRRSLKAIRAWEGDFLVEVIECAAPESQRAFVAKIDV
jgi:hypothetical protein